MIPVKSQGMTCWADSSRQLSGGWSGGLVFLSMFGDRNAVRAAWATLSNRKRDSVQVGDAYLKKMDEASYSTISAPLGKGSVHLMILHSDMTRMSSSFVTSFYQVGPNAEERFYERFTRLCMVPMRPSWRDEIWKMGTEANLFSLLPGFGLPVYSINTDDEKWAPLVKDALLAGRIG
jgi:hypothetical protein